MDTESKLRILADAAKYDVACTSSGLDRQAQPGKLGNAVSAGICHSFSADGRCITLLKVLYTNACVYDCAYCVNRRSNDVPRAVFDPGSLPIWLSRFIGATISKAFSCRAAFWSTPTTRRSSSWSPFAYCARNTAFADTFTPRQSRGLPDLVARLGLLADRISVNMDSVPRKPSASLPRENEKLHHLSYAPNQRTHRRR